MKTTKETSQKRKLTWIDDPRGWHYIDDDALFVLNSMARGHISGKNASYYFFIASWHPVDWDIKMLVKFMIKVADEYNLELKNFSTMTYAFAEEYEKNLIDPGTNKPLPQYESVYKKYFKDLEKFEQYKKKHKLKDVFEKIGTPIKDSPALKDKTIFVPPKRPVDYEGAYKWTLDEIKKKPQSAEGKLFSKIFIDKFDLADLKEIIKISDGLVSISESSDSIGFMAKKICNDIVNWTSFEVEPDKQKLEALKKDLDSY